MAISETKYRTDNSFLTVLCADKLYKVDNDRHVTEGISDADEGYQMKDAGGKCVSFHRW